MKSFIRFIVILIYDIVFALPILNNKNIFLYLLLTKYVLQK